MDENYTGVSEYTITLIKKLLKDHPENKYIIFLNSFKGWDIQKRLLWLRKYSNISIKHTHLPNKFLNFSLWFFRYPKLDRLLGGVDIFIAPNISFLAISKKGLFSITDFRQNIPVLLRACQKKFANTPYLRTFFDGALNKTEKFLSKTVTENSPKFILTIHDLSFERFKETFSWKRRLWHFVINTRKLAQRADEIWTVSNSTKWDLEALYQIPSQKIKVKPIIQNLDKFRQKELNKKRQKIIRKKYNLPKHFILYLGTVEPRKNILQIVKAFEYLQENKIINPHCKIVIAGQLGWRYTQIVNYIKKSKWVEKIILTDFVANEDKAYLYRLANIFVYPSLFEGFGIPVVEAMSSGRAVVTSNNSSLPEVIGDAGLMIDPDRLDDLIDALKLLLTDKKTKEYFEKKGRERVAELMKVSEKVRLLGG